MSESTKRSVNIAALGDLMLCGEWDGTDFATGMAGLRTRLGEADLVFANLETTIEGSEGQIEKQPRVVAREDTLECALRALGVDLVNLANNHVFDAHLSGYRRVTALLERLQIDHLGAGEDASSAARSKIVVIDGIRLGWLAFVDVGANPTHVAADDRFGVNLLDETKALDDVERLAREVDHVVVSLHWGVEYCQVPSPAHYQLARSLVEAGARLVLGHHAHVVQGVQRHGDGLIVYGLGNATTTDFFIDGRRAIRQTPRTRSSFALLVELGSGRVVDHECVPFLSEDGEARVDDPRAASHLRKANRLLARAGDPAAWRRRRLYEDVVMRIARKLHPAVITSLRPAHLAKPFLNIRRSIAGRGPAP